MDRKKLIPWLVFIGVFVCFALLRFYNLKYRLIFDWDQEQFTNQIKAIVSNHQLTLLGPRVMNDHGFFLAPYFTYLLIPFFLLTHLHPIALFYFVIFFNLLFFIGAFLIIRKLFSFYEAVVFLLLWATNRLLIGYDSLPWWPLVIPFGVLLVWWVLAKLYKEKGALNWISLGAVLGLFMNMHFQFIFVVLFTFLFIIFNSKRKHFLSIKKLVFLIGTFVLFFLPLALFDVRHNFLNTHLFFDFLFKNSTLMPHSTYGWLAVFTNVVAPFILVPSTITFFIFYFLMVGTLIYLIKMKKDFQKVFYKATLALWICTPILFFLYGRRPSEYYFNFLYPFIFITLIDGAFTYQRKWLIAGLVAICIEFNIPYWQEALKTNQYCLVYKDQVTQILKDKTQGKKFNIAFDTWANGNTGFNYLFAYYNLQQSGNFKDPLIIIQVPDKEGDQIVVGRIGVKLPKEL